MQIGARARTRLLPSPEACGPHKGCKTRVSTRAAGRSLRSATARPTARPAGAPRDESPELACAVPGASSVKRQGRPVAGPVPGYEKRLSHRTNRQGHRRIYSGERRFVCHYEDCGSRLANKVNWQLHLRSHRGERPLVCSVEGCGQRFIRPCTLNVHMKTHAGVRRFFCHYEGCTKGFILKGNLQAHLMIHTGEKPWPCLAEGCSRAFISRAKRKRHMITHRGGKLRPRSLWAAVPAPRHKNSRLAGDRALSRCAFAGDSPRLSPPCLQQGDSASRVVPQLSDTADRDGPFGMSPPVPDEWGQDEGPWLTDMQQFRSDPPLTALFTPDTAQPESMDDEEKVFWQWLCSSRKTNLEDTVT